MAQAKTLNKTELKQLLHVTNSCSRYPLRDSTMLLFTHLCGLCVGEVAALRFDDMLDANDTVRDEMTLDAARTKSKRARKIFFQSRCSVNYNHTLDAFLSVHSMVICFPHKRVQGLAQTLLHSIYNACMHVLDLLALRHTVVDALG